MDKPIPTTPTSDLTKGLKAGRQAGPTKGRTEEPDELPSELLSELRGLAFRAAEAGARPESATGRVSGAAPGAAIGHAKRVEDLVEDMPEDLAIDNPSGQAFRLSLRTRLEQAAPQVAEQHRAANNLPVSDTRLGLRWAGNLKAASAALRDLFSKRPNVLWPVTGVAAGAATFAVLLLLRPVGPGPGDGWQGTGQGTVQVSGSEHLATTLPSSGDGDAPSRVQVASASNRAHSGDRAENGHEVAPHFVVPRAKIALVNISFSADVDVLDVNFQIALPEGLAFWSDGQALAQRSVSWTGKLTEGENVIPVAIRGQRVGRFAVEATAVVDGKPLKHQIYLEVAEDA